MLYKYKFTTRTFWFAQQTIKFECDNDLIPFIPEFICYTYTAHQGHILSYNMLQEYSMQFILIGQITKSMCQCFFIFLCSKPICCHSVCFCLFLGALPQNSVYVSFQKLFSFHLGLELSYFPHYFQRKCGGEFAYW